MNRTKTETPYAIMANWQNDLISFSLRTSLMLGPAESSYQTLGLIFRASNDGQSALICDINKSHRFRIRQLMNGAYHIITNEGKDGWIRNNVIKGINEYNDINIITNGSDHDIFINGKKYEDEKREFGFRTFPEVKEGAKFTIAFGGCSGFVPEYESVWERIADHDPRAMLMLGDNVYIDDPEDVKWTGDYCYSRRHSRPEWKKLVAKTSMHAIYDDHDFGMDDCVPGAQVDLPAWKKPVLQNFINNWNNPSVGGEKNPGCWQTFSLGQVQFIMLDCRYYRDRKEKSMLGTFQKQWLKDTLRNSEATFKVIASSVPFSEGIKPGSKDPWDGYPEEREEIFSFIEQEKIEGVLLIAADRHRIDFRKTSRPNGYDFLEFVSGRITNRHVHSVIKTDGLVWGYNKTCGYCLLKFDTTKKNPVMKFEAYDNCGELLFAQKVFSTDLKFKQ